MPGVKKVKSAKPILLKTAKRAKKSFEHKTAFMDFSMLRFVTPPTQDSASFNKM